MKALIEKYIKYMSSKIKTRFAAYNILIVLIMLFPLVFSIFCFTEADIPQNFQQQTGFVTDHTNIVVPKIVETLDLFHSSYSFTLQDGSYYESMEINYELLDKSLFDQLDTNEEITITFLEKSDGTKLIYAISYGEKEYLSLQDSLIVQQKDQEFSYLFGTLIIVTSVGAGIILFVVNYKRNKMQKGRY